MMKCSCDPATFLNNENTKRQHWNINNVNKYKYKKTLHSTPCQSEDPIQQRSFSLRLNWTSVHVNLLNQNRHRFLKSFNVFTRTGCWFKTWQDRPEPRSGILQSQVTVLDINNRKHNRKHNISFQINLNRITSSHVLKFIHSQNTIYVKNSKSF